jgi:hypothetical protein
MPLRAKAVPRRERIALGAFPSPRAQFRAFTPTARPKRGSHPDISVALRGAPSRLHHSDAS